MTDKKITKVDIAAIVLFAATFVFLFIRSSYGFGIDDESLYISIPYRLVLGESLIADEWHVSQLSAFLLYLPVKLYVSVVGSTEGIMLFFRHMFVICQSIVSALVYVRLRKYGIASLFSMLIFMLHIPLTFMTMSYNSMGVMAVELLGLVLLGDFERYGILKKILVGFLLSVSVLCNPIILFVFIIYTLATAVNIFIKNKKLSETFFSIRGWCNITLGTLPLLAAFFGFLFSRTTWEKFIRNLPKLFEDPEYAFAGEEKNVFTFFQSVIDIFEVNEVAFILFAIIFVLLIIDKKRREHRAFYLLVSSVSFIAYAAGILLSKNFISMQGEDIWVTIEESTYLYWMMPFAVFSLVCYILTEKKNKRLFYALYLTGIVYSLCLEISSDLGPLSSTMGLAVSNTAGAVFIFEIVKELRADEKESLSRLCKTATVIIVFSLVLQVGMQVRIMSDTKGVCFEYGVDDVSEKLSEKIEKGPAKGLKTTKRKYDIYNSMANDIDVIRENCTGGFLVTDNYPWCYLYAEKNYSCHAQWILGYRWFEVDGERLKSYYELNPEKIPEYIYVPNRSLNHYYLPQPEQAEKIKNDLCSYFDCEETKVSEGYILKVGSSE